MSADSWGFPVAHACVKSVIESAVSRALRVTVFMVPPLDILLKISDQLFRRREHVSAFFPAKKTVNMVWV